MKNWIINICILLGLILFFTGTSNAQTRGAVPGELYISTDWYMDQYGQIHYAILHSTDNGKTISLKYQNIETPLSGEMTVGRVLGDATSGVLYNKGNNKLWVSFDYGKSWEYREECLAYTSFFSGVNDGLIFKVNNQGFFKSINYASTFELLPITITCPISEIGYFDGEFYAIDGNAGEEFFIYYTTDYANTYIKIPVDSTVAFWSVSGKYPQISRGTQPGELYLVSWWLNSNYKVFHSIDTGYTWTEKYESGYIHLYDWRVSYTAGREPGSFYVKRSRINPAGDHVWLYIDYSSDYGNTFTTYFHDLDLTVGTSSFEPDNFQLSNYPNPFAGHTTILFDIPGYAKNPLLNIYDVHGTIIRQYHIAGKKQQPWDGTDHNGNKVTNGIYFYSIHSENGVSPFNKILFIN